MSDTLTFSKPSIEPVDPFYLPPRVPHTATHYRLATPSDYLHVVTLWSRYLRELEPLGLDVLPTEHNIDTFWDLVFQPALMADLHGIVLAFVGGECVGATFYTPETLKIDVPGKRVQAHGIYVSPEHRRQGIAHRLQLMAHTHLCQLGFDTVVSNILMGNWPANFNATKTGYVRTGYVVQLDLRKCKEVSNG